MHGNHRSGLGELLSSDVELRFSSALSDHCPAIAAMFNSTGECTVPAIVRACENLVYLQCWPHLCRKVTHARAHRADKRVQLTAMKYASEEGREWIKGMVHWMHLTRSETHFDYMATVGHGVAW